MALNKTNEEIKTAVKKHYATAIKQTTSCCSPPPADFDAEAAGRFSHLSGYTDQELGSVPNTVTSFGCGNPVNVIDVKEGDAVLDLGSGSGLDLILAARKTGPSGKAIGLDMTEEMIAVCRENIKKAGIDNAEVRLGEMEKMPVADAEVDWIISNCVINLSPEKEKVFAESFRVLKPGGRMMVSDIITINLPDDLRNDLNAWAGCIAGAVDEQEYVELAKNAGFEDVKIVDKIVYDSSSLKALANDACGCGDNQTPLEQQTIDKYTGKVASIKLSAVKPG